jgi:hypothetical protein
MFFFNKKIDPDTNTNADVRTFYESKKTALITKISFVFIFINLVAMELIASGFSLSSSVVELTASKSLFLKQILLTAPEFFNHFGFTNVSLFAFFGKGIKFLILFIILALCKYFMNQKDPFKNYELLRNLPKKRLNKFNFLHSEIKFYSRFLPSNILLRICDECDEKTVCPNRIKEDDQSRNKAWCNLFALLPSHEILYWHEATYECRKAYFYKFGFYFTFLYLSFFTFCLSIYSHFSPNILLNYTVIITCLLIPLVLYLIHDSINSTREERGGAWRSYREKSNSYFYKSECFEKLMEENICKKVSPEEHTQKINKVTSYLSYYLKDKLDSHCIIGAERSSLNKENVLRVLKYLVTFLCTEHADHIKFRAGLFLINPAEEYLYPYILLKSKRLAALIEHNEKDELQKLSADFFSLENDSVAAKAYLSNEPIVKNFDLKSIRGNSFPPKNINSLLCYPLEFYEDVYKKTFKEKENACLPIKFGVLCVDTNEKDIFTFENKRLYIDLLKPFIDRIIYEMSLGVYYHSKERTENES